MDQKLLFLINREWTGPGLDRLMCIVTSSALWTVPLVLFALAVLVRGGFRARAFCAVVLVAFVLSDSVAGYWLKRAVGRPRPHQSEFGVRQVSLAHPAWKGAFAPVEENISLGTEATAVGRSFPSNHAANTASAAMLAAIFFRRGWLAFIPALLVAYSRIYTGSHWPSDVLAGVALGCGVALLSLLMAESLWRTFGRKLAPSLADSHPSLLSRPA